MTFNSYIFILLFLPLCLLGYFGLNRFKYYRLGLVFLLGMSLWFYGYFNPKYLLIICGSVFVNYTIYRVLNKIAAEHDAINHEENINFLKKRSDGRRRIIFIVGLIFNLGLLGYYKYANFFIENLNIIFKTNYALRSILLPLGISFFTFQQISFITDVYKARGVFPIRLLSMGHM